jgi:hypothetical protein
MNWSRRPWDRSNSGSAALFLSSRVELVVLNYLSRIGDDDELKTFSKNSVSVSRQHFPIECHNVAFPASARHGAEAISRIAHEFVVGLQDSRFKLFVPGHLVSVGVVFSIRNPQFGDLPLSLVGISLVPYGHISIGKLVQIHLKILSRFAMHGERARALPLDAIGHTSEPRDGR